MTLSARTEEKQAVSRSGSFGKAGHWLGHAAAWVCLPVLVTSLVRAQVSVVTEHNDNARTGQNLNETILTPAKVAAANSFGLLFSQVVAGQTYAQPLYVPQVTIPGKGVHNVVYVVTSGDIAYAFDADNNGGINATPLWKVTLSQRPASGEFYNEFGVYGTPVIDLTSETLYVVTAENRSTTQVDVYRLHALDITSGAEKFGGPVFITGSVAGTGSGSSGGVVAFDATYQLQRPALLLLNGVVYIAFGSINDNGPWHGWIFSYNASNLQQIDVFCTSPNGDGGGIWMSGSGPVAEVNDPAKPYGRMFVPTGNGTYSPSASSYGMTMLNLDLTGGVFTVEDQFTPYDEASLDGEDGDLGSGGPLLLPPQTTASGATLYPLVEAGKSGTIYILNRNHLGGFNANSDQVVQEVQTPISGTNGWGNGVWGSEAYWNNNIYYGGMNHTFSITSGVVNTVSAYSFVNGVLSTTPSSQTVEQFSYPGPTPAVSANGTTNGIVWLLSHAADALGSAILLAYDATNLGNLYYSSNTDLARDNPGLYTKFSIPTIANGKVYTGAQNQLSVFGLLGIIPTVAAPVISPAGGSFTGSQTVAITDATAGAQVFYTTDGTTPTVNSTQYTGPITVTSTETVSAIASATGYLQGAPVTVTFTSATNAANPVFSLAAGAYSGTQTLTITAATGATIYYNTINGVTPTTSSTVYSGPISIPVSETVQAFVTAPGLGPSAVVSATYVISPPYVFNFSQGFATAQGPIQFNGSTGLDDFRLQLTDGGDYEAGSAFYATPVFIDSFTTDFTFQLSNPVGDGITFAIQGDGPTALGTNAQGLGYAGMLKSLAIYFNMNNKVGLGDDATGVYIDGSTFLLELPAIDLNNTGIKLRSGDYMNVHLTYDSEILNVTVTDAVTLATWSHAYTLTIPYHVGGNSAYVGFTGGTGTATSSQKLTSWTYLAGRPPVPSYPAGFDSVGLVFNGSGSLSGTALQLTRGGTYEVTSAYYSTPVDIDSFSTYFDFTVGRGSTSTRGNGFTFVLQNAATTALGTGSSGLGYATIPNSVAIKFDLFDSDGEGADSTGVYTSGAMPTIPSISLASSGLELASGDSIHAVVTYDGTTLTWTLQDVTAGTSATQRTAINIPQTIGSNVAYVGFTASSGGATAVQKILDWAFNNQ